MSGASPHVKSLTIAKCNHPATSRTGGYDGARLASVVGETSATVPVAGIIRDVNHLLRHYSVFRVKTGWTSANGGCLMFAARVSDKSETAGQ
jgi:hypothetical protein